MRVFDNVFSNDTILDLAVMHIRLVYYDLSKNIQRSTRYLIQELRPRILKIIAHAYKDQVK